MKSRNPSSQRGFTLVELLLVIAVVSVLAALGVYGVRRYLATAKTAEAKQNVGAIMKGVGHSIDRDLSTSELMPAPGGAMATPIPAGPCSHCPPFKSCVPVPLKAPNGKKYQPTAPDYELCCWACAHYQQMQATYFSYNFHLGGEYESPLLGAPPLGPAGVEVVAHGDLDGDTVESTFALGAELDPVTKSLRVSTQVFEHEALE